MNKRKNDDFWKPDLFGIYVEPVKAWSTEKIKNGLMGFFVGAHAIGGKCFDSTLGPELIRMEFALPFLFDERMEISSAWSSADAFSYLKKSASQRIWRMNSGRM